MSAEVATVAPKESGQSLVSRMATRFGVEPNKMLATLKATAFKGDVSNEQMMALLVVAEQFGLNPWVKEIYAFPDKNNGIVPVVGVDGWMRILNENPQFDGIEFIDGPVDARGLPEWIECRIFRKDRTHHTAVREFMTECKRDTGPWKSHPRRMLRHKSMIQAARVAMSFGGIHDEDEAQRIIEGEVVSAQESPGIASINKTISRGKATIEGEVQRVEPDAPAAETKTAATQVPVSGTEVGSDSPTPASAAAPTYAEIADAINKAANPDDLAAAADLIQYAKDADQSAELAQLYKKRVMEMKGKK